MKEIKRKNFTLHDKLGQYSLLVAPALVMTGVAHAQIIYHDINPDILYKDSIAGDSYTNPLSLDLDGDGVYDIEFAVWSSVPSKNGPNQVNLAGIRQAAVNGNAIMGYTNLFSASFCSTPLPLYCPSALNSNKEIGPAANFWAVPGSTNLGTLVRYFRDISPPNNFVGQWNDVNDKYVGFRFSAGDNHQHYGWIRLDVSVSPSSVTLKDYAYEAQENTIIKAGEKGNVGIASENGAGQFEIYENNGIVKIIFYNQRLFSSTVRVTNILGQALLLQSLPNNSATIDLNQFGKGIYIITLNQGDESFSKEISFR